MRTVVRTLAALSVVVLLGVGCGQQGASTGGSHKGKAGSGSDKPVIGLVMKSLGNEYFQAMEKGAKAYAKKRTDLVLKTAGTQSETDISGQVDLVNNMVAQGVDAIVIAPADSRALVAPLKQAYDQGIKIVNIDVKLDDKTLKQAGMTVPFVGPDNVLGARKSGDVLAKALGPGGKVAVLEGVPGAANAQQRKQGFNEAIKDGHLKLVASRTAHWETDEADTVFTNLLSAHPEIQGVMSSNDAMTLGVVSALQAAHRKDIKIASFDNIPAIHPHLKQGVVVSTLDQYGSKQAAYGMDAAMKLLNGHKLPAWTKTPITVITKDDLS